jgi:hypothetical protein
VFFVLVLLLFKVKRLKDREPPKIDQYQPVAGE